MLLPCLCSSRPPTRNNLKPTWPPPPPPLPTQIAAAQKIFISNGGESLGNVIGPTLFNGGPDRAYNQFYEGMKDWGRYDVVSSPADADLVFEIIWTFPDTGISKLRLVILDPRTRITLWTISEYVAPATLLGNRDKNFDQAMTTVIGRLKALATPVAPGGSAQNYLPVGAAARAVPHDLQHHSTGRGGLSGH